MHFETILKYAERLSYEIQDILHENAWFEQECESFEGLWVILAFYRKSDTAAGANKKRLWVFTSLESMNDFIYFGNTIIYLSMWYHYQLHITWNQCSFMDHKKPLPDDIIGDVFVYGMLCQWSGYNCSR